MGGVREGKKNQVYGLVVEMLRSKYIILLERFFFSSERILLEVITNKNKNVLLMIWKSYPKLNILEGVGIQHEKKNEHESLRFI